MITVGQQEKIYFSVTSYYDSKSTHISFNAVTIQNLHTGETRPSTLSTKVTSDNPTVYMLSARVLANVISTDIESFIVCNNDTQAQTVEVVLVSASGLESYILNPLELSAGYCASYANGEVTIINDEGEEIINPIIDPILDPIEGGGAKAGTLSSWTLDTGSIYYADFTHDLATDDIGIELFDIANKEAFIPHRVDRIDTDTLRVYVNGNTSEIRVIVWDAIPSVQEHVGLSVVSKSENYTANNNDVVLVDASSGLVTITLPTILNGKVSVKKTDASVNFVKVISGGLVEGDVEFNLELEGEGITLACNGTNWYIL